MSVPSESAESPYPCACTNISLMQLFHELKQKFPGVPDHVVSNTIELYCHDKQACETHLHSEVKASLTHAYHASSSAAARQLNELKLNPPSKCRNQPIIKNESIKATPLEAIICQGPQAAILGVASSGDCEKLKINTDANQNILEPTETQNEVCNSPVTVINIDNCTKYTGGSPSDLELTNENIQVNQNSSPSLAEQAESTNYRILKSNKIRCNLNERLEKTKEKKTIRKEAEKIDELEKKQEGPEPVSVEKPKRPNTLDFIKPNPDPAFKQTLRKPENETCQSISPVAPAPQKQEPLKESKCTPQKSGYSGYPLNVSVNVNMDLSGGYDPWLEDYENRRAITSVNLTVCTPTSNMASPVRDTREDDGGFEGHVTVTVSPSTARAPRRRAPPPPGPHTAQLESPRPTRAAPEPPSSAIDRSLIERQKERLSRLAKALEQERGRLAQLKRETQIMGAPPPSPAILLRLRDTVKQWRDRCDDLSKRVESDTYEVEDTRNFYSNIYTGQRPAASWQCHMCTFRNHPLLDKCEECDMPRILVGTSPATTHDSGFGSFRDKNRKVTVNRDPGSYEDCCA